MNKVRAALVLIAMIVPNTSYAMSDDTQGHWAKDVIASWRETAWIGGYPDGTFRPDAPITRAEFVALLSTAAPLVEEQSFDYVDVTIDPWYAQALRKAKAANAISGYPGGVFAPTKPITRAEAASLIGRVKK